MEMIHKSHTKSDLIHIVNNINLNIRISHGDSKKQIHDKFIDYYDSTNDLIFKKNLYDIKDLRELKLFLSKPSPKKNISLADKQQILTICRKIIQYTKNDYLIQKSNYNSEQDLKDDILYILQFGDLPSVRRACKSLNKNIMLKDKYHPIISPQVQSLILEKEIEKKTILNILSIEVGNFVVSFD